LWLTRSRKLAGSAPFSAPSSMMKLMMAELVFHAINEGKLKLTDEYSLCSR
jgi:hypothetical protein